MTAYGIGVVVEIALAGVTLVALCWISAPYGRYLRPGWGPSVGPRIGWFVMELPGVVWFLAVYCAGSRARAVAPLVLAAMWQLHYVHRSLVFPLRLPRGAKRLPVLIIAMGVAFNLLNGWINAWSIAEVGRYDATWLTQPFFVSGAGLFGIGMLTNLQADTVLLRLRRAGDYAVPEGGLYRWISCPNYLGELVEWTGWALATWSAAGLAFALYTAANLVPRAVTHHRWYKDRFVDYPSERRAIVPYVL